jgi:hypothetical protein
VEEERLTFTEIKRARKHCKMAVELMGSLPIQIA